MSDKVKLIAMTVIIVMLFVFVPLMIIISINVLFGTVIPLTWQTWLAMFVLINALRWALSQKVVKGN